MTVKGAQAIGIASIAIDGSVLDVWYPHPELALSGDIQDPTGTRRIGAHELPPKLLSLVKLDPDRGVEQVGVMTTIHNLAADPIDAYDIYLRLHLLSHRKVTPNHLNLRNAMNLINTVVWTNKGPALPDNFEAIRTSLRSRGLIHVYGIDKLPRMVDYVVPTGINIAEAERVRLGAYLAPGTVVVREGYVSYNAGSLGACRIEGRLTSGVTLGEGCVIGLSAILQAEPGDGFAGERIPIHLGKGCILEPAAGLVGLSIGNNCRIGSAVLLDRHSQLYDATTHTTIDATELEHRSDWSVSHETGHEIPVIHFS